jgi:Firmicute plasmid replication protein (RepL)
MYDLLVFNSFRAIYSIMKTQKQTVFEAILNSLKTGETIETTHVLLPLRVKVKDWLMLFHWGSEVIAKDKEIGLQAHRVFWYILGHVDYENRLLVTQADVKEALEMKQADVSRAFKLLVKKEILVETAKIGTSKIFSINPYFAWKGSAKRLKERLRDEAEARIGQSHQNEVDPPSSPNLRDLIEQHVSA